MKTVQTIPDVNEHISSIEGDRQAQILILHELIQSLLPEEKPIMWGKIIGYGTYHYRYASGREGDWMKIGLANNKQYISVYVCAFRDGKAVPELYVDQFPKASIGRSCIRFKRLSDIDLNILKQVIVDGLKTFDTK